MIVNSWPVADVYEIVPVRIEDSRGYFSEVFKDSWFRRNIADVTFFQDNQSLSKQPGTMRGLHFQREPFAQGKLVRVVSGVIFDVCVDLRRHSPSFGQWVGVELSAEKGNQLWIPSGFAHGFLTLTPDAVVHYKATAPYSAEHNGGLRWDDPELAIDWPLQGMTPILSDKDRNQPSLSELDLEAISSKL